MRQISKKVEKAYQVWMIMSINVAETQAILQEVQSKKAEYILEHGQQHYDDFVAGCEESIKVKRANEGQALLDFYESKPSRFERVLMNILAHFNNRYKLSFTLKDGKPKFKKA